MSELNETPSDRPLAVDHWDDRHIRAYQHLAQQFGLKLHNEGDKPPVPRWFDNDAKVHVQFNVAVINDSDDKILDFDLRLGYFLKTLAKELHAGLSGASDAVGFEVPSFINSSQMLRYSSEKDILNALLNMASKTLIKDPGTVYLNWGLTTRAANLREDAEPQQIHRVLLDYLDRMADRWSTKAVDFELALTTMVGHKKRSPKDTWAEGCHVSVGFGALDEDGLITPEYRTRFFVKTIMIPDLLSIIKMPDKIVKVQDPYLMRNSTRAVSTSSLEPVCYHAASVSLLRRLTDPKSKKSVQLSFYQL